MFFRNRLSLRSEFIIVWLLGFAISIGVFWPALMGKVPVSEFVIHHQLPPLAFTSQTASHQLWPQPWNPLFLSGHPTHVGQLFTYTPPFSWLFAFGNYLFNYFFIVFALFATSTAGAYLLARELKISKKSSLIAAMVFAFSNLSIYWGFLISFNLTFASLPLILWSVLKFEKNKAYILLSSFIICLNWYLGAGEIFIYVIGSMLALGLYLDLVERRGKSLAKRFKFLFFCILSVVIGTISAFPRIITVAEFIGHTIRSQNVVGAEEYLTLNLSQILFPYLSIPFIEKISPILANSSFDMYLGILPLILTLLLLISWRKLNLGQMWVFVFLLGLGYLALINFTHIFSLLKIITLGRLGGSWKLLFVSNLATGILAGFAVDNISKIREVKSARIVTKIVYITAMVIFSLAVLFNFFVSIYSEKILARVQKFFVSSVYGETSGKPLAHYFQNIRILFEDTLRHLSFLDYHFDVSLAIIVFSALIVSLYFKNKIFEKLFRISTLALTAGGLILIWQGYYQWVPKNVLTGESQTAAYFKSQEGNFRVFRFWPGQSKYEEIGLDPKDNQAAIELNKELMKPNLNMFSGVEIVDGADHLMSDRQSRIQAVIGSQESPQHEQDNWLLSKISFYDKLSKIQSPGNRKLLGMLNAKYVITSFEFEKPWEQVFNSKTSSGIPIFIYENPDFLPRVYFANDVQFTTQDKSLADLQNVADFKKITLIECQNCQNQTGPASSNDQIKIDEEKPGILKIETVSSNPRWLVYSESNLPTWIAKINGQSTDIYTANYLYQAVYVPAGNNTITFEYPGTWQQTVIDLKKFLNR